MEPKVSPFQTGFLTEAGNINTSKQYYAFIEKEGLACWIVAEQIDSSEEKESAKLAAEQIIWDFSQKPTLSQSKLREYLTNAHQKLVNESGNIMLKASLVMVVSDYSRMVWAVSGNVRLYHFRDKVFNFRSKDQTMAQVMLDAGNLKEEEINRRNERSGLINYLGISTEFKPLISRVFPLHEGDKILICNLGLWEKVTAQDLTQALEANEGPAQVLKQLQENWLIKSDKPLKQFIGTLIYVDKISGKKIINYLTPQNVATCLSVLAIVGAGWLVGNIFSQTGMEPKTEKPQTINGVKKQPTATNRLSKEHKQIDLHNKVRQTQNSETEIHDENINWPNQNQPVETKKAEKRREEEQRQLPTEGTRKTDASKAPRQRWQVDVAVHKEPDVQSLPQRQKGAATASGNLSEPQTRQNEESKKKRQQE
ncbi:MAG TPA: hypothetical protein VEC37_15885, partial [Bacillota bacterium]|nr:hypothetical protein [Bacillota bacterium]